MTAARILNARLEIPLATALLMVWQDVNPPEIVMPPMPVRFTVAADYTITDLGTLPGHTFSEATAVNELGHVVGISIPYGGEPRAFLWTPEDGMRDLLGTFGGWSVAYAINDHDQVVGSSNGRPFLWSAATGMVALGEIAPSGPSPSQSAIGINNSGVIVGSGLMFVGCICGFGYNCAVVRTSTGFRGTAGDLHHLPRLRPLTDDVCNGSPLVDFERQQMSAVFAINELGSAAGFTDVGIETRSLNSHPGCNWATVWPASGGAFLPLGATCSEAHDINKHGWVVGHFSNTGEAFLWSPSGGLTKLGFHHGPHNQLSLNDGGQIAGSAFGPQAFVWSGSGEALLLPGSSSGTAALDINNRGQVVGYATGYASLPRHAVLWSPHHRAPIAHAGGPYSGNEGTAVGFDGTRSSDPDGDPLTYTWDFGDGATGSGASPSHSYTDNGAYTVKLVVSDGALEASSETTATIANVAPAVTLSTSAATLLSGASLNVTGRFTDPGVRDAPWSWLLEWGDATSAAASTHDQTTTVTGTHRYCAARDYTVAFLVNDKDGGTGRHQTTFAVVRIPIAITIEPATIRLNRAAGGQIKVVVATTSTFDASKIDPATVTLGDGIGTDTGIRRLPNGRLMASLEDADGDGDVDLVLHFDRADLVQNGDLTSATKELILLGVLDDRCRQIRGSAHVRVIQ